MSLLTMGTIAVGRDLADQGQPLADSAAVARELTKPSDDGSAGVPLASPASFGKLLVAQIPTEALIGYTTLLALFTAGGKGEYTIGRWALYGVTILVCALTVFVSYFAQKRYEPAPPKPAPEATNGSGPQGAGAHTVDRPGLPPTSTVATGANGLPVHGGLWDGRAGLTAGVHDLAAGVRHQLGLPCRGGWRDDVGLRALPGPGQRGEREGVLNPRTDATRRGQPAQVPFSVLAAATCRSASSTLLWGRSPAVTACSRRSSTAGT